MLKFSSEGQTSLRPRNLVEVLTSMNWTGKSSGFQVSLRILIKVIQKLGHSTFSDKTVLPVKVVIFVIWCTRERERLFSLTCLVVVQSHRRHPEVLAVIVLLPVCKRTTVSKDSTDGLSGWYEVIYLTGSFLWDVISTFSSILGAVHQTKSNAV